MFLLLFFIILLYFPHKLFPFYQVKVVFPRIILPLLQWQLQRGSKSIWGSSLHTLQAAVAVAVAEQKQQQQQ